MANFQDRWKGTGKGDILDAIHPGTPPIKPRLTDSVNIIKKQRQRFAHVESKLAQHDRNLFNRIVETRRKGDIPRARRLAGELVELRKTKTVMLKIGISLENIEVHIMTYGSLGDAAATIAPLMRTMKSVQRQLDGKMPGMGTEMADMIQTMGSILPSGEHEMGVDSSAEVDSILQEAAGVAGIEVDSRFPSTPTSLGAGRANIPQN